MAAEGIGRVAESEVISGDGIKQGTTVDRVLEVGNLPQQKLARSRNEGPDPRSDISRQKN
jgi:hypothetical protein